VVLREDPLVDGLARQRAAQVRYWRDDATTRPGGEWVLLDGVQAHTTGLPPRQWNGAHLLGPCDLEAVLPQAAAWFAERGKPWGLLVPTELDLTPPGMEHVTDQPVMLRGPDDLPAPALPAGLAIRWDAPATEVAGVQAEGFGDPFDLALAFVAPQLAPGALPRQRTATAYDGDQPIGVATVALMDDVAGIYGVAVRQRWRRRGVGAALTAAVAAAAVADGCDLLYLNPSAEGHGVYASLGFRDAPPYGIWHPAPPE
jgi:GNAT superfamily N-acetyltransferase